MRLFPISHLSVASLPNVLGFLALVCYLISLLPTILRIVFPQSKQTELPKVLLQHRRTLGVLAFFFALIHGYLLIQKRSVDFFDLKTAWIYFQGLTTLTIFTLLAITSNDWSVKHLKHNWKRLHQLTYLAMFLLTWHIWDKMAEHWTYLTLIGLFAIVSITLLFLIRRGKEHQDARAKAQKKARQQKKPQLESSSRP